jgi:hypothetical protein
MVAQKRKLVQVVTISDNDDVKDRSNHCANGLNEYSYALKQYPNNLRQCDLMLLETNSDEECNNKYSCAPLPKVEKRRRCRVHFASTAFNPPRHSQITLEKKLNSPDEVLFELHCSIFEESSVISELSCDF